MRLTGDGTPKEWAYIAGRGHHPLLAAPQRLPEGWQDVIRIYKKGELDDLAASPKPPTR